MDSRVLCLFIIVLPERKLIKGHGALNSVLVVMQCCICSPTLVPVVFHLLSLQFALTVYDIMSDFLWIAFHGGNLPINIDSTGRHTGNIILLAPFKGSRGLDCYNWKCFRSVTFSLSFKCNVVELIKKGDCWVCVRNV